MSEDSDISEQLARLKNDFLQINEDIKQREHLVEDGQVQNDKMKQNSLGEVDAFSKQIELELERIRCAIIEKHSQNASRLMTQRQSLDAIAQGTDEKIKTVEHCLENLDTENILDTFNTLIEEKGKLSEKLTQLNADEISVTYSFTPSREVQLALAETEGFGKIEDVAKKTESNGEVVLRRKTQVRKNISINLKLCLT